MGMTLEVEMKCELEYFGQNLTFNAVWDSWRF